MHLTRNHFRWSFKDLCNLLSTAAVWVVGGGGGVAHPATIWHSASRHRHICRIFLRVTNCKAAGGGRVSTQFYAGDRALHGWRGGGVNPPLDIYICAHLEGEWTVLEFLNNIWGLEPSRNRVVVPVRQASHAGGIGSFESIPGLLKSLKIRAQVNPAWREGYDGAYCGSVPPPPSLQQK